MKGRTALSLLLVLIPPAAAGPVPKRAPLPVSSVYRVESRPGGVDAWDALTVLDPFDARLHNYARTVETHLAMLHSASVTEVRVRAAGKADSAVVRPLSAGITPRRKGDAWALTIPAEQDHAVVEFDGNALRPLVLLRRRPDADPPMRGPGRKETAAVTYFGPGRHEVGKVLLRNKREHTVYLAAGAVLVGTLEVRDCRDLTIRGGGILHAPESATRLGPPLKIDRTAGAEIRDVLVLNDGDQWTVFLHDSNAVTFEDFAVVGATRDAVNVLNSEDIRFRNCYLQSHDDAFCVKGTRWSDRPAQDVRVEGCSLSNVGGGRGILIGGESDAPFLRRLLFRNVDILHCLPNRSRTEWEDRANPEAAICILPTSAVNKEKPSARVEDVTFEDVRIEDCRDDRLIDIWTAHPTNPATHDVNGVTFRNVRRVGGPPRPSRLAGSPFALIRNVRFLGLVDGDQTVLSAEDGRFDINEFTENVRFLPAPSDP